MVFFRVPLRFVIERDSAAWSSFPVGETRETGSKMDILTAVMLAEGMRFVHDGPTR